MNNEITSTDEMAETEWDGESEPREAGDDLVATHEAENKGIEFHVSMRQHTQHAMEDLIIEAAAKMIIGKFGERTVAKEIETKALTLIQERIAKTLEGVTAQIIDQPMIPTFGPKEPVTMREFLGLYGREYLSQRVGNDGNVSTSSYHTMSRAEWFVQRHMDKVFKEEISKATIAAITEVRKTMVAKHEALITAEMERFRAVMQEVSTKAFVSIKPA